MGSTLGTCLSVDDRATLVFLCALSVLTHSSVTAADGGTLGTDRSLIRGVCTVTAGSKRVIDAELGSMLTTSSRSKSVRSLRETSEAREKTVAGT